MEYLGYLVWWTVGSPVVKIPDAERMLTELGFAIPPPKPVLPIDAFRRLTGEYSNAYSLDDERTVSLELHKANSQHTMLVRHIVRTVKKKNGVVETVTKVGDCAFYKPPRGQNHRARMRVTVFPEALPDRQQVETFANGLRTEYDRALHYLDPQAFRRLVRQYLGSVHALYLSGPYFLREESHTTPLVELFGHLGGGSRCQVVPVVDDPPRREMLSTGLELAVDGGEASIPLVESYVPLGVVPETVWKKLEGTP